MISVVLPTYNETPTIVEFLHNLMEVLDTWGEEYEIWVMDDASPDGTAQLVEDTYQEKTEVHVVRRTGIKGLGVAIEDGLGRVQGDKVVVMDSDFNHDARVVPYLVKLLSDFDVVVGSRFAPGGGMYSKFRHFGSFGINVILRIVLRTQIQDNLCGFFAIRKEGLQKLPRERIFWGYGDYFFRLLFFALRIPLRILEIPVVYQSRKGGESKTGLVKTSCRYLYEIFHLKYQYWQKPIPEAPPLEYRYKWPIRSKFED